MMPRNAQRGDLGKVPVWSEIITGRCPEKLRRGGSISTQRLWRSYRRCDERRCKWSPTGGRQGRPPRLCAGQQSFRGECATDGASARWYVNRV